jgi:hypothetical protein
MLANGMLNALAACHECQPLEQVTILLLEERAVERRDQLLRIALANARQVVEPRSRSAIVRSIVSLSRGR